jgi:hypothetical protein rflaF_18686
MYFFKVDISSFDDEAETVFIIPEQNADENGVPFEEKIITQTAEYKAFVKRTKTALVDCAYTQYQTEAVADGLNDEKFAQLETEGKLAVIDANTYSISTGKSAKSKGKKNFTTYLIIGGIAVAAVILIAVSALSGSNKTDAPAETTETSATTETAETAIPTGEVATPETEIYSAESFEQGEADVPVIETSSAEPPAETSEIGYTNSGYSSSSNSGASGVYTITFYANGGEGTLESISAEAGQYVVLPSAESASKFISRKGYKLLGFSDNTDIAYSLYDYKMPYENVKMFAVWEPDTFTVNYNSNGGTGQLSRAEVRYGDSVPLPKDVSIYRDGLFLTGWAQTDSAKSALKNLSMPAENLTLYAVWSKKPPTAIITLHYDDKVQVIEAEIGSTLDMLDDFGVTKDGEIVSGWYFENSPIRVEDLDVSGDCDLYAKWQSATYITISVDRSYLNKADIEYKMPLDMTGYAKLTLPVVDDKNDIYNSIFGCTYGYSTKKQNGDFGTIEYYGGVESKFSKSTKLYRVLNEYGGGKGTAENPYIISYYDQLLRLSEQGAKGYFIQTADIAFPRNTDRNPISTKKIARGYENKSYDYFVYDGNGYSIKSVSGDGGLFGTIAAGTIQNVVVDGANIKAGKNKNLGVICNEIVSYAYPSTDTNEYFSTGNTRIIGCKVLNSKITADGAENIGGICGFGGDISDCTADGIAVSGGKSIGGIVGNACTVTGCIANNITVSGSAVSAGGIAGTAYGVELFNSGEKPHYAGGSIIGCGVRTFTSTAENSGGIVGTATAHNVSAYIKSCYAANIYLNGTNNGGIVGADGNENGHKILYCIVDNANNYSVIGKRTRSSAKTMILSVPADTGLTVEGVLSVLNAKSSGYGYWERSDSVNGGYPYPCRIFAERN